MEHFRRISYLGLRSGATKQFSRGLQFRLLHVQSSTTGRHDYGPLTDDVNAPVMTDKAHGLSGFDVRRAL
jgi:hypothetical protein